MSGVLRQDEQTPGVAVPHQGTSGTVLQHAVLDDLDTHGMTTFYHLDTNPLTSGALVRGQLVLLRVVV